MHLPASELRVKPQALHWHTVSVAYKGQVPMCQRMKRPWCLKQRLRCILVSVVAEQVVYINSTNTGVAILRTRRHTTRTCAASAHPGY